MYDAMFIQDMFLTLIKNNDITRHRLPAVYSEPIQGVLEVKDFIPMQSRDA